MQATSPTIYTVDDLSKEVKTLLEMSYQDVWVEGEVSSVASPASGHTYFSLKDSKSILKCVLFKNKKYLAATLPVQGERVLLRGKISLYVGRGDVQLICSYIEAAGEGELRRQFEALKTQLQKEGLFDEANKLSLPKQPRNIALITSPQGAVLHDILNVLQERYPMASVKIYPASVQGDLAKNEILYALNLVILDKPDVLILARGGGGIEDLQVFNDEALARAIHLCPIPLVSAIGHETDFVISDFVADKRAPTPTAAAVLITPDIVEIHNDLRRLQNALKLHIQNQLNQQQQNLDSVKYLLKHPQDRLKIQQSMLQNTRYRLQAAMQNAQQNRAESMAKANARLHALTPHKQQAKKRLTALNLHNQLNNQMKRKLNQHQLSLANLRGKLQSLSPLSTLARGYAIVQDTSGAVITQSSQTQKGARIHTCLHQGKIESEVL